MVLLGLQHWSCVASFLILRLSGYIKDSDVLNFQKCLLDMAAQDAFSRQPCDTAARDPLWQLVFQSLLQMMKLPFGSSLLDGRRDEVSSSGAGATRNGVLWHSVPRGFLNWGNVRGVERPTRSWKLV